MNEAIECLKLYMNNRKIGNNVSQEYLDMVNVLIESCVTVQGENTQLKQQLKDKDEKISKIEKLTKQLKGSARYQRCMDELDYILNIIKED